MDALLTDEQRREMVDERVCRILDALPARDSSMDQDTIIAHYLADEWACLEVAAVVIAPLFLLDATRPEVCVRLQRAAHDALKAECERIIREEAP